MQIWSTSRISQEEKENILAKHREVYNGYQTMQPKVSNTQPLYVQDFAKDKVGAMVNNDGTVTPYTNYRINESQVMDTCEQCGGNLTEKECMECGWKMEETKEGSVGDLLKKGVKKFKDTIHGKEKDLKRLYTADAVENIINTLNRQKTKNN